MKPLRLALSMITLLACCAVLGAQEPAGASVKLDISAQPMSDALNEFARQSGLQVVIDWKDSTGVMAPRVEGSFTAQGALSRLLENSGLEYEFINERTVAVRPKAGEGVSAAKAMTLQGDFQDRPLRLAQSQGESPTSASSTDAAPEQEMPELQEILVTAQKRVERLQDVPVPVTAITADSLVNSGQLRLEDYYTKFPAVSLTLIGDGGTPSPTIRGVTTGGGTNPTVGFVVDDVAFGMSTITGLGLLAPDFDPSELSRIEVLRGPQGTLYGASSLGGLIKYMTVDPSTERFSGRIQAGATGIKNGDEVGYNLRASVNVPLGETFAIRASGSTRRDPGYISDPSLGIDGVNRADTASGRLAALWRPSDTFSLKLSALLQNTQRDGDSYVFRLPALDDLEHTALRNTGDYELKLQAYSATATANLGRASLVSLTGYSVNEISTGIDASLSTFLVSETQRVFGVAGITNPQRRPTRKFSQEIRLSTPIASRIEWLLGAFYTQESYVQHSDILALDPSNGAVAGSWFTARRPSEFDERAVFTNLTFDVTDRFDLQVGGRASSIEFATGAGETFGPWNTERLRFPSQLVVTPEFVSEDTAFTYLVTPRVKLSPDLMMYARVASGYRPGGPNPSSTVILQGRPKEYTADTTRNYEVGVKGSAFSRALSFDASLYYIDWTDIQIELREPVASTFLFYTTNAGGAKSKGVELSMEWRSAKGLSMAAWAAYNDAELSQVPLNSLLAARPGDRLPYSSRYSGNLSIDREFSVLSHTASIGASFSYVDDRIGSFQPSALIQRATFPSYTQLDLRAGTSIGSWSLNAFVNNATDERGILRRGADALFGLPYIFNYIQPRTFGLSATMEF